MTSYYKILFQSFVKPFYRENAGAFLFFIIILFCIIGKVDGAELFEYHLSLATGILQHFSFLLLVLFAWGVYARKFMVFVSGVIHHPQFSFLQVYNQLSRAKRLRLFFVVEVWLLLPIILYCLFLFYVTLGMHSYLPIAIIVVYLLAVASIAAHWHVRLLNDGPVRSISQSKNHFIKWSRPTTYSTILLHFVVRKQLVVWSGIKLFTCGLLYGIVRNNSVGNYDIGMAFLFYTFGMLANGVLVFRVRTFEETYLSFYKGLAVPLVKRFLHYCFFYAVLFIPEILTIFSLYPAHLTGKDTIGFTLMGFSMLLLLNSLTFHSNFTMKEYLKLLFALLLLSCFSFSIVGLVFLNVFLALSAILLFIKK